MSFRETETTKVSILFDLHHMLEKNANIHKTRLKQPPTVNGFRTGTLEPSPQSQSFFRSYGFILPTFLAYIVPSTRGCSPWRPDAVMSTTGHSVLWIFKGHRECTGHHATCGALPAAGPYLRLSRFQGGQAVKQKNNSFRNSRRLPNLAVNCHVPVPEF
ncbi:hypothetical protein YC2023_068984 [Brassica napus]